MMTSRERVRKVIDHEVPDKVPLDFGGIGLTSISASAYAQLRKALGLPHKRVKVVDTFQMLGEVEPEVGEMLGVDTTGIGLRSPNEKWREWELFDGTEVLVRESFNPVVDENGDLLLYPGGDTSGQPSMRMPKGGYYFDAIVRQKPIDEDNLDPREWLEGQLFIYPEELLRHIEDRVTDLFNNTSLSIIGFSTHSSFGDVAAVPGMNLKDPKGIRDPKEWYIAHITHPEYIRGIFELQCEASLKNLKLFRQAVGDKIDVIIISGTDFGSQNGPFISPDMYRDLYMPFHKRINDWIHENTNWKTFYHSCGSVVDFLDDFVEAGVDILNPVQCSAAGMDPTFLKENYGDKLVFWGGGIDTQKTLPFGTPEEIRQQVRERMRIFGKGGGFVFAAIHNIQQKTPPENLKALFDAVEEFRTLDE